MPTGKTIVAYGCGDMWTNMLQPFWAIALLGITQLRARDIIGYTVLIMLITGPFIAFGLYFCPARLLIIFEIITAIKGYL